MTEAFNMDCMDYMATLPDGAFDLAVVDPPYGIGMDGGKIGSGVLGKTAVYEKKSGTRNHHQSNILSNCAEWQRTRLFLEQTTS